jgi:hypothetical protein
MMKQIVVVLALSGCASTLPSGRSTFGKERQAQLCLDDGALRVGNALSVERNVCRRDPRAPDRVVCSDERIGTGEVVRVTDQRCAIVRLATTMTIERGDRIAVVGALPASRKTALASRAE